MCEFEIIDNKMKCKHCGFTCKVMSRLIRNCPKNIAESIPQAVEPTLIEKASNLANSVVDWAKSGFQMSSDEEIKRRLDICQGTQDTPKCEFFNNGACGKCGCNMNLKTRLQTSNCPVGKW